MNRTVSEVRRCHFTGLRTRFLAAATRMCKRIGNPGDVKKREDAFGVGMAYPRVIPHSDGAGTVDTVGEDVSRDWISSSFFSSRAWLQSTTVIRRRPATLRDPVLFLQLEQVSFRQNKPSSRLVLSGHRCINLSGTHLTELPIATAALF